MPTNDTLTGAGLVEAVARSLYEQTGGWVERAIPWEQAELSERVKWMKRARAALRAAVEAAGVDGDYLRWAADSLVEWPDHMTRQEDRPVAAFLRALAEVVEAPDGNAR